MEIEETSQDGDLPAAWQVWLFAGTLIVIAAVALAILVNKFPPLKQVVREQHSAVQQTIDDLASFRSK